MPDGLEAWYRQHAGETGQSLNAAIVTALEDYRRHHGFGTMTAAGTAMPAGGPALSWPGTASAAVTGEEVMRDRPFALVPGPPPAECAHAGLRMTKGVCPDCNTYVTHKP